MEVRARTSRAELVGYICAIGAGASYGAVNFLGKIAVDDYAPPLVVATIAAAFGTAMLTPLVAREIPNTLRSQAGAAAMYALSGMAASAAAVALFFSLQRAEVIVVSPLASTTPLITLILAHLFLQRLERLTLTLIMGTLLVVGGAVLVVVGDSL